MRDRPSYNITKEIIVVDYFIMDERDSELWKNWVEPYYLFLMHGRWFHQPENCSQPHFVKIVKPALANINDSIIEELISYRNWRHRAVGCWFAGIKKRSQYIDEISKSLDGCYCSLD